MLRIDGGVSYEAIRDMPYEDLVAEWEAFVAHVEARAAAERAAAPTPPRR